MWPMVERQLKRAQFGAGVWSSIKAGPNDLSEAPWPPPALNLSGATRPPTMPMTAAASTMKGKGRLSAKIATKAAAAMPQRTLLRSAREPMR